MTSKLSIFLLLLVLIFLHLLRNRLRLSGIPGPWLAAYTRLWKLHNVWQGQHHHTALELHRRHGHLVRIGPNHISVSDPKAIPIIYGVNKSFTKVGSSPGAFVHHELNWTDCFLSHPVHLLEEEATNESLLHAGRALS